MCADCGVRLLIDNYIHCSCGKGICWECWIKNHKEHIKWGGKMYPEWWPECPWPKDIWTMTDDEYAKAIPDGHLRTAISGFLMRKGWELACEDIRKRLLEQFED